MYKKVKLLLIIMLLTFSIIIYPQEQKPQIAILDFKIDETIKVTYEAVTENLTTSLEKLKKFNIIERTKLEVILKEVGLSLSGIVDEKEKIEPGKIKGIDLLVTGSLTRLGNKIMLCARFINPQTAEVLEAEKVEGENEEQLSGMIDTLSQKIANLFQLEGVVLEVDENNIYINLGKNQGVKEDDIFIVYREGEEIKDLQGNVIGVKKEKIAEVKIKEVDENISICEIIGKEVEIEQGDKIIAKLQGVEKVEVVEEKEIKEEFFPFPIKEARKLEESEIKENIIVGIGEVPIIKQATKEDVDKAINIARLEAVSMVIDKIKNYLEKNYAIASSMVVDKERLEKDIIGFIKLEATEDIKLVAEDKVTVRILVDIAKLQKFLKQQIKEKDLLLHLFDVQKIVLKGARGIIRENFLIVIGEAELPPLPPRTCKRIRKEGIHREAIELAEKRAVKLLEKLLEKVRVGGITLKEFAQVRRFIDDKIRKKEIKIERDKVIVIITIPVYGKGSLSEVLGIKRSMTN